MKKELIFNEEKHEYRVGDKVLTSVTQFVSWFFPEFDKETISQRVANKRGVTQQEVLDEWESIADNGTLVHKEIEDFILGKVSITSMKSFYGCKYYANFTDDTNFVVTPEWRIFSEELGLAGTIDLFLNDLGDNFKYLVDWKTNEKLSEDGYGFGVRESTKHIPNSKLHKYYLQLNVYAYILKQNYGVDIDEMFIIQLKETECEEFLVPDMQEDVQNMIKEWKER